jgi:hypothetical protein
MVLLFYDWSTAQSLQFHSLQFRECSTEFFHQAHFLLPDHPKPLRIPADIALESGLDLRPPTLEIGGIGQHDERVATAVIFATNSECGAN